MAPRKTQPQAVKRSKTNFKRASDMEGFFGEAGVYVSLYAHMKVGLNKSKQQVAGWKVEVFLQTWEQLQEMEEVVRAALQAWAHGRWDRGANCLRCQNCGERV